MINLEAVLGFAAILIKGVCILKFMSWVIEKPV